MRRVSFYTEKGNVFYLELAIDRTEFVRLYEFDANEAPDPDALLAFEQENQAAESAPVTSADEDNDELLKSLGM